MIPKIIHYCWFGHSELPDVAKRCVESWHQYMPDWQYVLWNEDNFSIDSAPTYVRQAYAARKFAFVSDYVRLYALHKQGGIYLDVDFLVYKSFSPLLSNAAFAGYEGSKRQPVMMGVLGSIPEGEWVSAAIQQYDNRSFHKSNDDYDLTPNTSFFTDWMIAQGLTTDGQEKHFLDLHIYPVDYFCPRQTSGEYFRTTNTYCEHCGLNSWSSPSFKDRVLALLPSHLRTKLILLKRRIFK